MADLSQIEFNSTTYNLKDATARGLLNGHTVNSDVPANAKFTDTTYSVATTSANGLMSSTDKSKLNSTLAFTFVKNV